MSKIKSSAIFIPVAAIFVAIIVFGFLDLQPKDDNSSKPSVNNFTGVSGSSTAKASDNAILNDDNNATENKNVAASSTSTANKKSVQQNGLYKLDFGFNIGFLTDYQKNKNLFAKAMQQIQKDGITDLRVYEPFTNNLVKEPGSSAALVDNLVKSNFNVLLSLSNYPNVPSIQYNQKNAESFPELEDSKKFTNRYPPANIDAYESYLTDFLNTLKQKNDLKNMSFEIGNEPDAKKFFWGNSDDFKKIAVSTASVLQSYQQPVYCCAFTSEFSNTTSNDKQGYIDLARDRDFRSKVNLSFHFYQNGKYYINNIKLPILKNSIITEFNFYAFQKQSTDNKNAYSNSPAFGSLLIQSLVFAYNNGIKKIYLFKLCDTPDKDGSLGFFDTNGNPKGIYNNFIKVYNVIKDGYRVEENGSQIKIIGQSKTITYSKTKAVNAVSMMKNKLTSNNANNPNFMGDWNVSNN